MKHIIKAALLILLISNVHSVFAQEMTLEEYNYITKGIKIQLEAGLEPKRGYSLKEVTTVNVTVNLAMRTMTFKAIYRDTETKPFAFLCVYKNNVSGFEDYICIPCAQERGEYWNKTYEIFSEYDEDGKFTLTWGLAHLATYLSKN